MKNSLISLGWKPNASRYSIYPAADKKLFYRPDTYDHFILEELWKNDEYFLEQVQLPSEGVIIDIGAHIGAFALRADYLFPARRMLVFEPFYDNYKVLKNNIITNRCRNITPFRAAVTGSGNRIPLYISERNTAGHSSVYEENSNVIFVPAMQLEQVFKKYHVNKIALLKIDCEGGEYDILYNMNAAQFAKIRYLALEYHPSEQYDFASLQEWIASQGLQMIAHKAGYFPRQGTALFINPN